MTPFGHVACGVGVGGVITPLLHKSFKTPYRALTAIFLISSLIPDLDGLSLLISHRVYFGKWWYSHHMLGHSILGALIFASIISLSYITIAITIRGITNLFRREKVALESRIRRYAGAWLAALIGYLAHLMGDLLTPPGPWGGIALFWPDQRMYGGWSKIYWQNYYIIYIAIAFLLCFLVIQILAGLFSSIKIKYMKWLGIFFRVVSVIISLFFIFKLVTFIKDNNYKDMGRAKWMAYNRTMVPAKYLKNADNYHYRATVFWRKNVIKREDLIKLGNRILDWFEDKQRFLAPAINSIIPSLRSQEEEMRLYRALQGIAPGMEDSRPGDYRVWILRDAFPDPRFYDRAFTFRFIHRLNSTILQITNAWMIIFRIDERDKSGDAIRVSRIYQSNKIYVPTSEPPQLNRDELKFSSIDFWKHNRIQYNLIPRSSYSRYRNLIKGFFPSQNTTPGYVWPGIKTGYAIHAGMWSAGCIIAVYGHFDIGTHLKNPFFPLWESADNIINIHIPGNHFLGKKRVWGRLLFIRDPKPALLISKTDKG
jgi:hypothetical protein